MGGKEKANAMYATPVQRVARGGSQDLRSGAEIGKGKLGSLAAKMP